MRNKKVASDIETISSDFNVRRKRLPNNDLKFIEDYAEVSRQARNRVSRRLYKNDNLKKSIAYGELRRNAIHKPFEDLRQDCNGNTFQKDIMQVVENFEQRLACIKYKPSKVEQKHEPLLSEAKKELVGIWKPTLDEMIAVLEKRKGFVNENRKPFYERCIHLLQTNKGLFPLIQKYQQRYLNGLHIAKYKSKTFCVDNMLGVSQEGCGKSFVEKINENIAVLHLHFAEIRRNKKVRRRNLKTGVWEKKKQRVILREERNIDIPVRYSERYHGDIKDYADTKVTMKKNGKRVHYRNEKNYRFVFNKSGKDFRIVVAKTRKKKEIIESFTDTPEKFEGVDANFRDNAIVASDGWEYQWSPQIIKLLHKFLDALAKRSQNIEANGNLKTDEWNGNLRRIADKIGKMAMAEMQYAAFLLIQHMKENGKEVLVAEDLETKNWKISGKFDEKTQNRAVKQFLKFGQWKHILERACKKHGIVFALTNPMYTSQTCPICGLVAAENRPFNEETKKKDIFNCLNGDNCSHPDINAAKVIRDRMANPRLRAKLQWYNKKKKIWQGTKHTAREFYQNVYEDAYRIA